MSGLQHGVEVIELDQGTRPIKTVTSSVIGLIGTAPGADAEKFPLNKPVLIAGKRSEAAALVADKDKEEGTLPAALDGIFDQVGAVVVVIRVEEVPDGQGKLDAIATMPNVLGSDLSAEYEGIHAFLGAEAVLGVTPRILVAPGFTHQRPNDAKNPVVDGLNGIAQRLRAVVIADGPNDTHDAAVAYKTELGSKRIFIVDPHVKVFKDGESVVEPASARVAGMIAKSDNERGFWWSPSNQIMNGIVGTARSIDFQLGDPASRADLLNKNHVATIIRKDGFRLWGNRTATSEEKWAFLSVVRTADMINDSLLRAHMWAVDRNITKTYIEDVTNGVQSFLDNLKAQGAILGGSIWADEDLNSKESIQAGKIYFNFDFTPPTPAEHIVFRSILTNDYLEELV
ncbi:phage tail sheath subtilisin-like domain-containing protein [Thalassomonas actiniarum]|uniref:Phage tail sheath subtilisin-like domain-containing protein n=1 Tax=Thalassomonas actiniarum TaxID=485447 RepID=A0AAE9YNM7_9GAMM|nr:phage tail sheath subtilisin-like domain-containing protein [Thalassomonas actiniarum]WDD98360.1 phage tail sheath subtilisin-like domain-containing protein [Thalassomonas actiniarum]